MKIVYYVVQIQLSSALPIAVLKYFTWHTIVNIGAVTIQHSTPTVTFFCDTDSLQEQALAFLHNMLH